MMGWGSQGYGMGWFGGIFMILFWLVILVAIVLAIRYLTTGKVSPSERAQSDPLRILQERYARGEISTEEYEERKNVLSSGEGG